MAVSYLLLGTNLGDRGKNLEIAVNHIVNNACRIITYSAVYESEAWGYTDINAYYNLAIEIQTLLPSEQLLETCKKIEQIMGRVKTSENYEARIIDIDILFYNHEIYKSETLEIPHPRLHLRKFVLTPLLEICPEFIHPVFNKAMDKLLTECKDTGWVKKVAMPDL